MTILNAIDSQGLSFPFPEPPVPGAVIEVAPGVLWARVPLPYRLNHVNIYLIEDGDGWAVIDTGIGDAATKAAWLTLTSGPLAGRRLTRLFVTHYHPDHIGLAGRLYMATEGVVASGTGTATIPIAPPLRAAASLAEPLVLTTPTVAMRLASDDEGANPTRPGRFTAITIRLEEALP